MGLSQQNFDRAEEIGDALHMLDGLIAVMERELMLADLGEGELRIWPLLGAMRHYRLQAATIAGAIARSGREVPA
ncbi:MAG: hypothetical protein ACK4LQ_02110 [Pararhodobacter sp.]